jgi:hypothetical protein
MAVLNEILSNNQAHYCHKTDRILNLIESNIFQKQICDPNAQYKILFSKHKFSFSVLYSATHDSPA